MAYKLAELIVDVVTEARESNVRLDAIQKRLEYLGKIRTSIPLDVDPGGIAESKLGKLQTSYLQILSDFNRHLDAIVGKIPVVGGALQSLLSMAPSLRGFVDEFMRLSDNLTRLEGRSNSFGLNGRQITAQYYEVTRSLQDMGLSYNEAIDAYDRFSRYTSDPQKMQTMTQQALSLRRAFSDLSMANAANYVGNAVNGRFADNEGFLRTSQRYLDEVNRQRADGDLNSERRRQQIVNPEMQRGWGQQAVEMRTYADALRVINNQWSNFWESVTRLFGGGMAESLRTWGTALQAIVRGFDRFVLTITGANNEGGRLANNIISWISPLSWTAHLLERGAELLGGWDNVTRIVEREFRLLGESANGIAGGINLMVDSFAIWIAEALGISRVEINWTNFFKIVQDGWDKILASLKTFDKSWESTKDWLKVATQYFKESFDWIGNIISKWLDWMTNKIVDSFLFAGKQAALKFVSGVLESAASSSVVGNILNAMIPGGRILNAVGPALIDEQIRKNQQLRDNAPGTPRPAVPEFILSPQFEELLRRARAKSGDADGEFQRALDEIRARRARIGEGMAGGAGPNAGDGGAVPPVNFGRPPGNAQFESITEIYRRTAIAAFGSGSVQDQQLSVQTQILSELRTQTGLLSESGVHGISPSEAADGPLMLNSGQWTAPPRRF